MAVTNRKHTCSKKEAGRQARSLLLVRTFSSTETGKVAEIPGILINDVTVAQGRRARNQGSSTKWNKGGREEVSRCAGRVGWTVST